MMTFHHMMIFHHIMILHYMMIFHHMMNMHHNIKNDVIAPQMAFRPVRVQVGGCAEVFRNFYNVKKYYGSPS